jgi:hypothetical protein
MMIPQKSATMGLDPATLAVIGQAAGSALNYIFAPSGPTPAQIAAAQQADANRKLLIGGGILAAGLLGVLILRR